MKLVVVESPDDLSKFIELQHSSNKAKNKNENSKAVLPPNTHFMTQGSLQPALCVLGGKLELGTTVTTVYQLLRLGQIPTEPRGVVPTGNYS